MNKVSCEICGTFFPEDMENCPTCGCSREYGLDGLEEELLGAEFMEETPSEPRKRSREIFDFDEVNQEEPEEEPDEMDFDDEEDDGRAPRSNTVLVVILLILIVLLLLTAGFFFLRYFLPNMKQETKQTVPTTVATQPVQTETTEPTVSGIPCTDIVIPGGKIELGKGGMWLMNVQVYPDNTTDALTYVSYDENVVTVTQDGTVTAVGEGQTTIEVTCGMRQIKCNVVVDYGLTAETKPEETLPGLEVKDGETEQDSTESTDPAEETQPEETTAATQPEEFVLKLKKNDITIFARYDSATLEVEGGVDPKEMTWFTMDSTVAIVHDGVVTSTGSGITRVYGEYKGQQVECIVRCNF